MKVLLPNKFDRFVFFEAVNLFLAFLQYCAIMIVKGGIFVPSVRTTRAQLALLQPLISSCSLKTMRKGQNLVGEMMRSIYKDELIVKQHSFALFDGAWIIPKDERRQGVILYLHGGGFTCGDLEYALGFGSTLASSCGTRVFCAAYRLAPETPFPGALDDALAAYLYLIQKGYTHITLCGESAGGGLCYSLFARLKEMKLTIPDGIIAISPWVDLTMSGDSALENKDRDVSLTLKQLQFYAKCYTDTPGDNLVSPLFSELQEVPPSLIFVAEEEILRSDAQRLHEKLRSTGCKSKLIMKADRWHAYPVYGLKEDASCFTEINHFLEKFMCQEQKLRWMRLDNAAKIYPAARNEDWSNIFRLSANLTEDIDMPTMENALDITIRRFPSIAVRLRRGVFWYYLQQISQTPPIHSEYSYPLTKMHRDEVRQCALRVIVHEKRVAIELFHSITDGNGALVFLKSLVAEYLHQRYGISIPPEHGVLGRLEEPKDAELEDSFLKLSGKVTASRQESTAWHLSGTPEASGFLHLTCMTVSVQEALALAHHYGVSLTVFLTSAMLMALQNLQQEIEPHSKRPLKVQVPVNLRKIFPSQTLRNFAFYTNPEIDPRLGSYTFEEICSIVKHRLGLDITAKQLAPRIAANVNSEKMLLVRLMPLPVKNLVMKAIFNAVGEKKACLSLSNLGQIRLPEAMYPYVERMDFILGVQAAAPNNCGVLSFKDKLYINFIRDVRESGLEYHFYRVLRDHGLQVSVESNTKT